MGDVQVERGAARRRQSVIDRAPHERVREPERAGAEILDRRARDRGLEQLEHGGAVGAGDGRQQLDREHRSGHRRDLQQIASRLGEAVDAPPDHRTDAVGAVERVQRRQRAPMGAVLDEGAGLHEVAPQLAEQERVAVGLLGEHLDRPCRYCVDRGARRGLDERGDALTVEAGDLHAREAFETVELGERLVEGVVDIGRRLAMRGDQTQAQRQRRAEPVQYQLQRGPAGPLEVVQHEQDGCAPAGIDDEVGDGVEVRDARILAERQLGRVVRVVRIGLQQRARPLRVGVDDAQVVGVGEQVLERVDHGAVRRPTPFAARAEEHGRAIRGSVARRTPRRGASCPRPVRRGRARRGDRCAAPRKTPSAS